MVWWKWRRWSKIYTVYMLATLSCQRPLYMLRSPANAAYNIFITIIMHGNPSPLARDGPRPRSSHPQTGQIPLARTDLRAAAESPTEPEGQATTREATGEEALPAPEAWVKRHTEDVDTSVRRYALAAALLLSPLGLGFATSRAWALPLQMHDNCMANALRTHGNCMATAWHMHGKRMATAWHLHGNCMAAAWRVAF